MTAAGTEIELSKATIDMFASMATALEPYETGGSDGIIQAVLSASTVDEYNAIFEGGRALPLNKELKIERARYAQSDFGAGLPFYLVVDVIDRQSGEVKEYTIGATVPVAMLTRAAFLGQMPIIARMYESDKPTKSGYKPVNVEIIAVSTPGLDAPAAKKTAKA